MRWLYIAASDHLVYKQQVSIDFIPWNNRRGCMCGNRTIVYPGLGHLCMKHITALLSFITLDARFSELFMKPTVVHNVS